MIPVDQVNLKAPVQNLRNLLIFLLGLINL